MPDPHAPLPSARIVPALDGIRGLAQSMIMAYHYFPLALPYAAKWLVGNAFTSFWIAVDLFFVLSGFLITGILLDHRPARNFFRSFYARRVLRIFPLYWSFLFVFLVVMPAVLLAVGFDGPYPDMPKLLEVVRAQLWFWAYLSNFWQVEHGFPGNGLGIIWTLAIEEQFYLVWPLVVFAVSSRRLAPLCVAIAVGSALLRGVLAARGQMTAAYFITFCHTDAIALGALGAVLVRSRFREPTGRIARWIALALGVWLAVHVWMTPLVLFTYASFAYWLPLCNVLFAALVVALATAPPGAVWVRPFASAPLTFVGRYSYSLYLLHFPAFRFVQAYAAPVIGDDPWVLALAATALCVTASMVTYRLIEQPFLSLKRRFPYEYEDARA